jgi:large subunit ribosomal protein L3
MKTILGTKIGMTQIFNQNDEAVPVTIISAGPCYVVKTKNITTDGYNAVQIGYEEKKKNINRPLKGYFAKYEVKPFKYIKEFRNQENQTFTSGQKIEVDVFSVGEQVEISGWVKGRGFSGVVKRHNFAGGPKSHGQSDRLRAPGAIGSQQPQRVKKGTRMAGHLGTDQITIKNLEIVKVDPEKNLLLVKGAVPGPKKGLLIIKKK